MKRRALLLLAGLLLALASALVWQFRFEAVPGALEPNGIADPPVGWRLRTPGPHEVREVDGQPVIRFVRKESRGKSPGMQLWLGPLEGVRYLHIHGEGRWHGVERGDRSYMIARFVLLMKDAGGRVIHPPDPFLFGGAGDSEWVTVDAVYEMTREMKDTGLDVALLAKKGEFEVRDLTVTAVRQRPWVLPATGLIVFGWTALFAALLRLPPATRWWRFALTAILVTGFCWFAVFPQSKNLLRPVSGGFPVEREAARRPDAHPRDPQPPAAPTAPKPAPPKPATTAGTIPSPKPAAPLELHETRDSSEFRELLGEADRGSEILHLLLFTAFALAAFTTAGRTSPWPLLLVIAVLSELVPNLLDPNPDTHDLLDLVENLAGVGLGLLLWKSGHKWLGRSKSR